VSVLHILNTAAFDQLKLLAKVPEIRGSPIFPYSEGPKKLIHYNSSVVQTDSQFPWQRQWVSIIIDSSGSC